MAGKRRPFSRDFAPAGSRVSSPRPVGSTSFSSAARSVSEGVRAGCAVRDPGGASASGERKRQRQRPGSVAERALCAGADPARPRLLAPAAAEAGREERPSAPRADGGASPPRLSRCTEGAAGPRSPRQSRSMGKHRRAGYWAPRTRVGSNRAPPSSVLRWTAGLEPVIRCPAPSGNPYLRWGRAIANLTKVALVALLLRGLVQTDLKKKMHSHPHIYYAHPHTDILP